MTDSFLVSLGEGPTTTQADEKERRQALALEAMHVAKENAVQFFNSTNDDVELANEATSVFRDKGLEVDASQIVTSETLQPEEKVTALEARVSGRDLFPQDELAAGIEASGDTADMTVPEIREEKRVNTQDLLTSLIEHQSSQASGDLKETAVEFLDDAFIGTPTHEVANAISARFDTQDTRANLKGMIAEYKGYVESLPADEQKKELGELISDLRSRSGTLTDSDYGFYQASQILMSNWDGTDNVEDFINQLGVTLEAIPLLSGLVKGVRFLGGTYARRLSKNKPASTQLAKAASTPDGEGMLDALGATPADVAGHLHMPQQATDVFDPAVHYIDTDLVDASKAASRRLDAASELRENLGTVRVNNSVIADTPDGFSIEVEMGKKGGDAFKTKKAADALAEKTGGSVVKRDEGFYVKHSDTHKWSSDDLPDVVDGISESSNVSGWFNRLWGRNAAFKESLNLIAHSAEREGVLASVKLKEMIEPYTTLNRKGQTKVNKALSDGDIQEANFTADQLRAKFGLNSTEVEAYQSVRAMSDRVWSVKNARARGLMLERGWRAKAVNGEQRLLSPTSINSSTTKVRDASGQIIETPTEEGVTFWRVMGEEADESGQMVDIIALRTGDVTEELPFSVLNKIDGALPRQYQSPYFIKKKGTIVRNGQSLDNTETVMTVSSRAEGQKRAAMLEDGEYVVVPADELLGTSQARDVIDQWGEEGLLLGRKRRPQPVDDITGEYALPNVGERIGALVNAGQSNAGIGRYLDVLTTRLNKEFGDLGFDGILRSPSNRPSDPTKLARYEKGLQLMHHIRNLRGLSVGQTNDAVMSIRQKLADFVFDREVFGSSTLGRELAGGKAPISDAAKKATFTAFLAMNPVKQVVLQATMAPTYVGVNGGAKYLASGRAIADMMSLASGKKLPGASKDFEELQSAFRDSGAKHIVDDHILTIGRAADAGIAKGHAGIQQASDVVNTMKQLGMDTGVLIDKSAAFLFASERWRVSNGGRLPRNSREWKEVFNKAEQLALNQNRSDTLFTQNGALSIVTQFMSHQIKMTGRMLGRESDNFTKGEKVKLAVAHLSAYGAAGFGLGNLYEQIKSVIDVEVPPEVDQVIRQGLTGAAVNMVLNIGNQDDPVEWAFSDRFAPATFMGDYPGAVSGFVDGFINSGESVTIPTGIPAIDAFGDMAEAVTTTAKVFGHVVSEDVTPWQAVQTVVPEYLRLFPITHGITRAKAAITAGEVQNTRGQRLANVPQFQGTLAAIMGIQTQDAVDMNSVMSELYGGNFVQAGNDDAIMGATVTEAKEHSKLIIKMLDRAFEGEVRSSEFVDLMDTVQQGSQAIRSPMAHAAYMRTIWTRVQRHSSASDVSGLEMLKQTITRAISRGQNEPDTFLEVLRVHPSQGMKELADELEAQIFRK